MSTRDKKPLVVSCHIRCLRCCSIWGKIELSVLCSFLSFRRHFDRVRGLGLDPVVGLHRTGCISAQEMCLQPLWSTTTQNQLSALVILAFSHGLLTIWCYSEWKEGRALNSFVGFHRVGCSWAQEFFVCSRCEQSQLKTSFQLWLYWCSHVQLTILMLFWAFWWFWHESFPNIRSYDIRLRPESSFGCCRKVWQTETGARISCFEATIEAVWTYWNYVTKPLGYSRDG